jgi:hypothetical protein
MFLLNTAGDIYYNSQNTSGQWGSTWSPVGVGVGATAIASGRIAFGNTPYVFLINGANNIYYNYQTPSGTWAGWTPAGIGVGATAISTGVLQVSTTLPVTTHVHKMRPALHGHARQQSLAPAIFEPYIFMINGAGDVYYEMRNADGSFGPLSPVGIGVGATVISAYTLNTRPYVTILNGAGAIYTNFATASGAWAGWSLAGTGSTTGVLPAVEMAAITSDYSSYTFALNPTGQLFSTFGSPGLWSTWFGVGMPPAGVSAKTYSVTSYSASAPSAFVIGTDGNVYFVDQVAWATWSAWTSLGVPS